MTQIDLETFITSKMKAHPRKFEKKYPNETEIILQNPNRVKGLIAFFFTITVAQILLVLKKKQFEKVQAAEMNF